jgi:chemotaxis protein CheD
MFTSLLHLQFIGCHDMNTMKRASVSLDKVFALQNPMHVFDTNGMLEQNSLDKPSVFLRPGDWFFGRGDQRVSTLLGSCIAVVMWSPRLNLGGMCHCLLPRRSAGAPNKNLSEGHYVEEALAWLSGRFSALHCQSKDIEVVLAGGGSTNNSDIGQSNVVCAQEWLAGRSFKLMQQDVGGRVVRRLTFNLTDGRLTIAHGGRIGRLE